MYGCSMQLGGNDQWSNILGGVDLIRRKEQKPAYGLTFKLLTTSEGIKMGKTMKGAVWLDPAKTSPYEFYQYWRNIEDVKVEECLSLLTFLPMDEVRRLGALKDAEINYAKDVLAFEITKLVHGEEEAVKAREASKALFGGGMKSEDIPTTFYKEEQLAQGIDLITLMVDGGLATTRSDARRTIQQGGVTVNDVKITEFDKVFTSSDLDSDGMLLVRKGKKAYHAYKIEA
jgi:tyrosyl-tRNA synthetase